MGRIVSLSILSTLIVILGLTFFRVLAPFLIPLFLAGVTALLVQPWFQKLIVRCKGRTRIAAGLLSGGLLLAILIPLTFGILLASLELYTMASNVNDEAFVKRTETKIATQLDSAVTSAVEFANGFLPKERQATPDGAKRMIRQKLRDSLIGIGDRSLGMVSTTVTTTVDVVGKLLSTTVALLIGLTIYLLALYYFLADGPELLAATQSLIPLNASHQKELLQEFAKAVRSVVLATFMAAIAQGVATTVALQMFGFGHLFALLILSTIFSLIPLAGAWIVWAPFAISLAAGGHWVQALVLTVYGLVVVGMLDNVVRAWVLKTDTKLHPLLAFVSVLGGIQTLGLWGVFVGPIVASCLYALIRIFNTELTALSQERQAISTEAAAPAPLASPVVAMEVPPSPGSAHEAK
jgi:predicted PurR-regulated permease PerM